MQVWGVIPARLAAQRLPRKPLVMLGDKPLVRWVYEAAAQAGEFDRVVVATDSDEIAECVRGFGGEAEMTRADHTSGSDRVAEVAGRHPEIDVAVNVQGDQPFVTAQMLGDLIKPFRGGARPPMTTLGAPLDTATGLDDPNVVKVVCARTGDALYFSRSPIPYFRTSGSAPVFHHVGLYAFEREFLIRYATMPPTPLEEREGLEQLRVLENVGTIRVCPTPSPVLEINTPEDLERATAMLEAR
jgi:3-deoxy-manno-octulosonate cytidylyltransferase (CMP-KDO synthetase)